MITSPTFNSGESAPARPMEITPRISPCRALSLASRLTESPPPATANTPPMAAILASLARPVTARMVMIYRASDQIDGGRHGHPGATPNVNPCTPTNPDWVQQCQKRQCRLFRLSHFRLHQRP